MPPPAQSSKSVSRASFTRAVPRAVFVLVKPTPVEEEPEVVVDEGLFFDEEENSGFLAVI